MVVNLDVSTGAFYKAGPLIGLCMEFLGIGGTNPVPHLTARGLDPRKKNELLRFLRNVKVRTQKKQEGGKIRPIKDLSKQGADDHVFMKEDNTATTVAVSVTNRLSLLRTTRLKGFPTCRLSSR